MDDPTCEDRLSEMLSSTTIYIDQPVDRDCVLIEIEMSMVDGSKWFQRFTVTNTELAAWSKHGTVVLSK